MKSADVDSAVPQNGSDASNHSRHIAVMHHQHMAVGNRFDMKTVNLSNAALARVAIVNKDASGQRLLGGVADDARSNGWAGPSAAAHVTGSDFDSTLFGDQESVDDIHPRADVTQQAG